MKLQIQELLISFVGSILRKYRFMNRSLDVEQLRGKHGMTRVKPRYDTDKTFLTDSTKKLIVITAQEPPKRDADGDPRTHFVTIIVDKTRQPPVIEVFDSKATRDKDLSRKSD